MMATPDDDVVLELYRQQRQRSQLRRETYAYKVNQEFQWEVSLLSSASETDLDFDYKLILSRTLRKLRRKLKYDRTNYLRRF